MTHADYNELLAAAALDALDADEARALSAHVATCAECRAELQELRAAVAALSLASAPVAPDPQVRARLLAQLKSTPQANKQAIAAEQNGAPVAILGPDVPAGARVLSFAPFSRRAARGLIVSYPLAAISTIAATVAIAALVISALMLRAQNRRLQVELTRVSQNLHETQTALATVRGDRELFTAPFVHTVELVGAGPVKAYARLTFDTDTGRAFLSAADLPAPPPGKAYQLWFIADGKPLPGSLFITDARGRAELRALIPPAGRHAQVFAVTLEQQSGAQTPTMPIYLKGAS
jgi:anti-sigma-K factor RskA